MAEMSTKTRSLFVRVIGALAALVLVATLSPVAGAQTSTEEKLESAEAEFDRLKGEVEDQEGHLEQLMAEAAATGQRVEEAQGLYEQITQDLRNTTLELHQAQDDYAALQARLDERARETFITGPGTEIEFLLGATSLADLSARVEYMNALNETDADLATQVQNLKNELSAEKSAQEHLQAKRAKALREWQEELAAVEANLAEQQRVLDDLEAKKSRMAELVEHLEKRYKRELAAISGLGAAGNGILKYCPVDPPRAVYDGFGAPRYGGGYHPHAGNDIIAPQGTPIRAPFDGYARASSNGLGGNAVYVYGDLGYVYNAHLVETGYTGPVQAGDVIGHVGATGDTSTPHDHFEWHPNVIPSDWPVSPYGYSVIGSAVNPWPLLAQAC